MSEIRRGTMMDAPCTSLMSPTTTECRTSWPGRWWKASAIRVASVADRSQQAERLEQMKSEFLVAQQRRRDQSPRAADRPAGLDHDIVDGERNTLQ
jgi:hypothetical protein